MIQIKTIAVAALVMSFGAKANEASPVPVENFEVAEYMGTWNQLSAIPASFQEDCIGNTTAEYELLKNDRIKVVNSCDRKNGKRKGSEARARVDHKYGLTATLEVTFVKIFKWIWSFAGEYWVIYINEAYDTAIVGHPEYKFGWILSKKESLNRRGYLELKDVLEAQGYDPCRFIMSNTPGQSFEAETSLCDI